MNDNDLERQLRTQAGPREEGYVPARLPMSPDEAPLRRPSAVMRAAVLVPAVAAGVLTVAIGAALLSRPSPSSVGAGSETPSPIASEVKGACVPGGLGATAEDWGGAAGSRGTIVRIGTLQRGGDCLIDEPFTVTLRTASGVTLVEGTSPSGSNGMKIGQMGGDAQVGVSWSNWCGDPIDGDIVIVFRFRRAGELAVAPGGAAIATPPCNGQEDPPTVSVTKLERPS